MPDAKAEAIMGRWSRGFSRC